MEQENQLLRDDNARLKSILNNDSSNTAEGNDKTVAIRTGYEIIERTIDKYGQFLLPSDLEVNTWWTNTGMADSEVIQNYHAHGECEQFHSEIKTDMDVERLPSGKFDTNELVLELTILAYSIGHLSHPITLSTYLQAYWTEPNHFWIIDRKL